MGDGASGSHDDPKEPKVGFGGVHMQMPRYVVVGRPSTCPAQQQN